MAIIPSYLVPTQRNFSDFVNRNYTLKTGQVIKINYPDPNDDKTDDYITYDILVMEQHGATKINAIYKDCLPAQPFGGAADFIEFTYRSNLSGERETNKENSDDLLSQGALLKLEDADTQKKLLGAWVLIMCIGGNGNSNAIILGAVQNYFTPKVNKTYNHQGKEDGHYLNFNFNGVHININNEGELVIAKNGATNNDGSLNTKLTKKEQAGSFIKVDKDGQIIISTTTKFESDDDFIKPPEVDKADNKITIKKNGEIEIKINDGKNLLLKDKDGNAQLTLGSGDNSVAVAEKLRDLYGKLKNYVENAVVNTAMGPSTSIVGSNGPAPSWDSAIESSTMKLPK